MPTYKVTDPNSGIVLKLTGDSAPSEQELEQIFSQYSNKSDVALPKEQEVLKKQSQRVDSVERLRQEAMVPYDFKNKPLQSALKIPITAMKTIAVPFQRAESAVSGLGLGLQKGSLKEGIKRAKEGLTGEKVQEYGDLIRTTGYGGDANEAIASTVGFTASLVAPLEYLKKVNKSLSSIQNFSDKGLMKAGKDLLKGSDEAVSIVGKHLDDVYAPINKVKVNPNNVLDDIAKMPETVIKHLENEMGSSVDDILSDFDISKARQLKRVLGELKPTSFGKAEKGAIETIQDMQINKAYSVIKRTMQEALESSGLTKEADSLLKADSAFSDTLRSSKFIRKTITDATLRKPTKTGSIALRMAKEGDLSARYALNTLKSASSKANKSITKAIEELDRFNQLRVASWAAKRIGTGAVYGGIGGVAGGKVINMMND